jgi:hypothetical protein
MEEEEEPSQNLLCESNKAVVEQNGNFFWINLIIKGEAGVTFDNSFFDNSNGFSLTHF